MRFVDASVFVHAYLKPNRRLSQTELDIKDNAKAIVARVNSGEKVMTTVVHLAEIANILEDYLPLEEALAVEAALLFKDSISIASISREGCFAALQEVRERQVGLSDAVAYITMKENGVAEVYSFDKDFDRFRDIRRISA
jgi:predicted nucleic acid-binding protein